MNEQELNNQIEANDFTDELSDEVLDSGEDTASCTVCFVITDSF